MECPKCRLLNPEGAERCDCGYDFATGEMKASYLKAEEDRRRARARAVPLSGFGGWLLIPAISQFLAVPVVALALVRSLVDRHGAQMMIATIAALLVGICTIAFFRKKRYAPRLMIAQIITLLALDVVALAVAGASSRAWSRLAGTVVSALIWIPYFLVSERVEATFTE